MHFDGAGFTGFRPPELVGFDRALDYIRAIQRPGAPTIVALDQPTIVPNGAEASRYGFNGLVAWFDDLRRVEMPRKADQDRLDASICLMIAIRWRLGPREESIVLGDLKTGYMVAPVSAVVRNRIMKDALTRGGL